MNSLKENLIDEFGHAVHPILPGAGISALLPPFPEINLRFRELKTYDSWLVQTFYETA